MRFENKVVLISGGGPGIGAAAAMAFFREGAKLSVTSSSLSARETMERVRQAGGSCIFIRGDVSVEEQAEEMVRETVRHYGRIDVLLNNAGIVPDGYLHETKTEDFQRAMDINAKGTFLMCRYAVRQMLEQGGGVIVNNASVAGLKGHTNRVAYAASKGAVIAMTRSIALEYCQRNIRCNCVCPGTTLTGALQHRIDSSPDPAATLAEFNRRQPLGRLGRPEEIAEAILFAADERAAYMTGSVIVIDGGMTM